LPADVPEVFVAARGVSSATGAKTYHPTLLGTARVHFTQSKSGVDVWESLMLTAHVGEELSHSAWDDAEIAVDEEPDLEKSPQPGVGFASLPAELMRPKTYSELAGDLKDFLYRTHTLHIRKCPTLKQFSKPAESEGDFRTRLSQLAREQRDLQVDKLKAKYAPKLAMVQERMRKAQQKLEKEEAQASQQTMSAAMSFGSSILGALFGRKLASATNVNRAASAMRAAGRAGREKQDVTQAQENIHALQTQLDELEVQFQAEVSALDASINTAKLLLEPIDIKPRKADIDVTRVALAWVCTETD
jgi:hypothetical protein